MTEAAPRRSFTSCYRHPDATLTNESSPAFLLFLPAAAAEVRLELNTFRMSNFLQCDPPPVLTQLLLPL